MGNKQEIYIAERMAELAQDIDNYNIGEVVLDVDGAECKITNKSKNSIEVFIERKSDKGISCKNWFAMRDFNKRFKKIIPGK